jgi:ligand-binding sensor protein/AraC-like DNA-binding protein
MYAHFNLKEIAGQERWLSVQDSMAEVTGMAIITVDYKGIPVTKHSRCQKFCEIMRSDPQAFKYCQKCDSRGGLEAVRLNRPYIYLCHANVVDVAIPIIIEEKYIGAVMAGQILLPGAGADHNLEKITNDARLEERFKSNQLLWAYYKTLPIYTMEKIDMMTRMINNISKYIVEEAIIKSALYNLNRRLLSERNDGAAPGPIDFPYRLNDIMQQVRMLDRLNAGRESKPLTTYSAPVCAAFDYVQDHIEDSVTLDELAKHCHVSKSYFSRLFKKETGETFSEYVSRQKMQRALEQLVTTNKAVCEISNDLGFSDCGYFIKRFKKYEGVTPAIYRKRRREKSDSWAEA